MTTTTPRNGCKVKSQGRNGFKAFSYTNDTFADDAISKLSSLKTLMVLNKMVRHMMYGGRVNKSLSEIGRMLSMDRHNTFRSVTELVKAKLILHSGHGEYFVAPSYKWKGNGNQHTKALELEQDHHYGKKPYQWGDLTKKKRNE